MESATYFDLELIYWAISFAVLIIVKAITEVEQ
jgi:hypothetical protein